MTLAEFPSLRRAQSSLPMLIAALSLALATALPMLPPFYVRAAADTLFAALIFHGLLGARLPLFYAVAITALSFAQAGVFLSAGGRAGSIWLAIAVYCVANAAAQFVRYRDARRLMMLGGALSLAQLLDPMGALLAMFLLPVCVGLPRPGEGRDKAGLLALLLFMPVVTAIVLAYVRGVLGFEPMGFALTDRQPAPHVPLYLLLLAGFACAPALWLTMFVANVRRASGLITIYTALAVLAAAAFAFLIGAERDMATVLAAMAASSAAALGTWRNISRNAGLALAVSALAAVVSWLLFNLSRVLA